MDAELLASLRALVDANRLRIVGRLAGGPAQAQALADELRLPLPMVRKQLDALVRAGIVEARPDAPGKFAARADRIGELARGLAALQREAEADGAVLPPDGAWPHDGEPLAETLARLALTPDEAKTLRAFLVDGRLVSIPAQAGRRDVILRFLLERVFTDDREYPEKEVNQRLALFHPDVASLRRYLVDGRYVERDRGVYRRRG